MTKQKKIGDLGFRYVWALFWMVCEPKTADSLC